MAQRTLVAMSVLLVLACDKARISGDDEALPERLEPTTPPLCIPTTPARCSVRFAYPRGAETRCELRGSFDAWGAGLVMAPVAGRWEATVETPKRGGRRLQVPARRSEVGDGPAQPEPLD